MKKIIAEAEFTAEQLNKIAALARATGLCEQTVAILFGRGVDTQNKINAFIHPGKERFLSPRLLSGMDEAVALITRARDEDWSVVIYGDYDADGICASSIMCRALADFGIQAAVYIPERTNGYGLNIPSVDEIFDEYFPQLFITVDCGISNANEVEYIKEQGAEVIVTDHHELPEILPDCICINPKIKDDYPYDNLCGAGVAFKVACALNGKSAYQYLDFAAIATVADSVPLTGENRDIVAEGLNLINSSPRKNYAGFLKREERVTSQSLAFNAAPKINAAGRMGDANAALSLFLSENEREIYDYSVKLSTYNTERQKCCDELYLSAKQMLVQKGANGRIVVLCGESWNAGFVGIVAARLAEEYSRPALLFVKNGNKCKGSARSVEGVNIYEALKSCADIIEEFGGHSQAAGVNIDESRLDELEERLEKYLLENYSAEAFTPARYINGVFTPPVSAKFVKELNMLEPFGVGNRKPQFVIEAESCRTRALKEGSQHLLIKGDGLDLIFFSGVKYSRLVRSSVPKQMIFEYTLSSFKGREQLQGYVRDVVYNVKGGEEISEAAALNCISVAAGKKVDCNVVPISKDKAQKLLSDCGSGAIFIANSPETLKNYDLCGAEINVFTPSSAGVSALVLLSPSPECDLSAYENIIYLDNISPVTLPALAGKTVFMCTEIDGVKALRQLTAEREQLLSVFKEVSANEYNLFGENMEDLAQSNSFSCSPAQALFALKVFEELGLVTIKGGKPQVTRGIKTQLTNSKLYNYICSLKSERI